MKGDGIPALHRVQVVQTPTGPLAIYRTIAERLLKEGVISGTLDGALHAADALTVKAATMAEGVCDFCSAPGVTAGFDTLDFDMPLGLGRSVDGWAACGPCADLIKGNHRKLLINRSMESMAFSKFTKPAIEELHAKFWKGLDGWSVATGIAGAVGDFINEKLPDVDPVPSDTERDLRIQSVSRITGLTRTEVEAVLSDEPLKPVLAEKLHNWGKRFGGGNHQRLIDLMNAAALPHKPMAAMKMPHWLRAMEAQGEVTRTLTALMRVPGNVEYFPEATNLHDAAAVQKLMLSAKARETFRGLGFAQDLKVLPGAEVYSFNAETEAAIIEASNSIPHDAPLSSIETPNAGSGWFWFDEPLPVAASPAASDKTQALLWAWVKDVSPLSDGKAFRDVPALLFSAYVMDEKGMVQQGKIYPSTRWYWPLSLSFHDMIAFNANSWSKTYGPGSKMEGDPAIVGLKDTLAVIASLSLFLMQSCVWFRQTVPGTQKKLNPILTMTEGHIERHARKRHVKEFKLDAPPKVHVVALRKTARVEVPEGEKVKTTEGGRDYHCRWIVKGHNRMQACGPGRKDRKLIWIEAHPAGPEDMPLRTKRTVYAVVR